MQITQYLEEESSFATAERVLSNLLEAIDSLSTYPESNGILHEISDEEITYRRLIKWSYRIIYNVEETTKRVYVVDVDHVRKDPLRLKEAFKK